MSLNKIKIYMLAAWIMVIIGVVMILLTLLGSMTNLSNYSNDKAQKWDRFDPSLPLKTLSLKTLKTYAEDRVGDEFSNKQIMNELYDIVTDRFTHGDQARYNIFSNWLLYLLGLGHPAFALIHDPDVLLHNGHSALCSEQSYLLLMLAERFGIHARHVGLNGHVVMEAWYDGKWHMYDPDLEVVPAVHGLGVISVETVSREPQLIRTLYKGHGLPDDVNHIVRMFRSWEDNTFMSYPRLAHFEWKVNVLSHFERITNRLKWIIPLFMVTAGVLILVRRR